MAENTLRQALNNVVIEGVLLEKRMEIKGDKEEDKYITGELDIRVKENEVHTVRVFSKKYKSDGSENKSFPGLLTVLEEYKSVAEFGEEEADKVRVSRGNIQLNEYYGQDGQLRSYPSIRTNFINRVDVAKEGFEPRAEFEVELFVKSVREETNKEGNETGRAVLDGYIPLFGGIVIPFTFKVNQEGAEYVLDNYETGQTVSIYGDIINHHEKIVKKKESAFGKDKEIISNNTIREYLVTGGFEPYDEDDEKAYNPELIKKALVERETYLEELKNRDKDAKKETKKGGFGSKSKSSKKPEINPDDLPF